MLKNNPKIYVCLCSKVTESTFIDYVRDHSSLSLDKIYNGLNVGNTCSACRLQLEISYLETKKSSKSLNDLNRKFNFKKILSKFIKNLDIFFSLKKVVLNQVAPIFGGDRISTSLIISNVIPEAFDQYAAVFKAKIFIRDLDGKIIDRSVLSIKQGVRFVLLLNKYKILSTRNS